MLILETDLQIGTVFKTEEEGGDRLPNYTGSYKITPKVTKTVLRTKDRSMTEDLTVFQIPYAATNNSAGGQTVVIGLE